MVFGNLQGTVSEILADFPIPFENLQRTSGDFRKFSGHLRQPSEEFGSCSEIVGRTLKSSEVLGNLRSNFALNR